MSRLQPIAMQDQRRVDRVAQPAVDAVLDEHRRIGRPWHRAQRPVQVADARKPRAAADDHDAPSTEREPTAHPSSAAPATSAGHEISDDATDLEQEPAFAARTEHGRWCRLSAGRSGSG